MNLTNIHNPVFDFTVVALSNGEYDFSLKYKGKEMDIEESEYTNDSFSTSLKQSPDEFLDFEAEYFPNLHKFKITFEPAILNGLCTHIVVSKKDSFILIGYEIWMDEDELLTMKYNPFRLMKTLFAKANKNGMHVIDTIDRQDCFLFDDITYTVPANGNLVVHFRNGIKILEQAYSESVKEMEKL
jgi:hypothetical protein